MTRWLLGLGVLGALAGIATAEPAWRAVPPSSTAPTVGAGEHPISVVATGVAARWAVICEARDVGAEEARRVDRRHTLYVSARMIAYLVRGGGEGQRIDEWIMASGDDRWLVFLRDGALILLDDAGNRERTLVEPPVPALPDHTYRVAVFDAASRHLAYLRSPNRIVIRELASAKERTITIPGETVARIVPEPVGTWARVLLRRRGKDDAERRYEPPPPPTTDDGVFERPPAGPHAQCYASDGTWSYGLEGAQRWLDLETGELREDPEVQARLGDVTIRRTRAGALTSGGVVLVPASCAATVYAVSVTPLRIVATCAGTGTQLPLEIFGPGLRARGGEIAPSLSRAIARFVTEDHFCVRGMCVRLADGQRIPSVERTQPAPRLIAHEAGRDLQPWDIGPLRWFAGR
ncbi:MAG: hypothetical protein ABIY55_06505 [Kofleriaceae bacterium]